jgi:hypothetical protein
MIVAKVTVSKANNKGEPANPSFAVLILIGNAQAVQRNI